jgi:hypothetical protein
VVRRDGLRTVSRNLFESQDRSTERSMALKRGREATPTGRYRYGSKTKNRSDVSGAGV